MGVVWNPPRSWEGRRRLPETTTPSWWQGARHPRLRQREEADPGSRFGPALRSPPHPSPQDLASPRPSLRPFLHFHSLPAPSPEFPPFLPPPFLPPRPWPSPAATSRLTRLLWTSSLGVLGSLPALRRPRALPTTPPCPPRNAPPPLPTSSNSTFPRAVGWPAPCVRAPRRTVRGLA